MEQIHIDTWMFTSISTFVVLLLGIIAVFLRRLLSHIDKMTEQIAALGTTLMRIDKDLSGEVAILAERDKVMQQKVQDLDPMWDRLRSAETRLVKLETGCEAFRCKTQ